MDNRVARHYRNIDEMGQKLDSATEFEVTLVEIDILLREAETPGEDEDRLAVMNKSALLLLSGKFESFLEAAAEEYVYAVNQLGARARDVPHRLLVQHSVTAVDGLADRLSQGDTESVGAVFVKLARLWAESERCSGLSVKCEFSYGRHGQTEIEKLLRRIGFDNIFSAVTILDEATESFDGVGSQMIDVAGEINSMTSIRNNILHQNASPSLTASSIRNRADVLRRFAVQLVALLQGSVNRIEQVCRRAEVENAG